MKVKVAAFSVSIDGFGAGPRQDIDHPLGVPDRVDDEYIYWAN